MKSILFSIPLTWMCYSLFSCNGQLNDDVPHSEYPLKVTSEYRKVNSWVRFDRPEFGRLYDYWLKRPKVIQTMPCKGCVTVDKDGRLYCFILSQDHMIDGNTIPSGSKYEAIVGRDFKRDGYMIYLSKDTEIQGYFIRHKARFYDDYHVDFYGNGSLKSCKLANDMEIQGLPCKGGKDNSWLLFYPDGRIKSCYLAREITINGATYKPSTKLVVNGLGKMVDVAERQD